MTDYCHCGNETPFNQCCEPIITGSKQPSTAEQLMRSRYSAFFIGDTNYLIKTLAPEKRQPEDEIKIQRTVDNTQWVGLKIVSTENGQTQQLNGVVEFIAFYQENGIQQLHEKSRFIKQVDQWFYLDGEHLPAIKLKRNDACFCNSGQKYKRCHGK